MSKERKVHFISVGYYTACGLYTGVLPSNDTTKVTCKSCKKTKLYKSALENRNKKVNKVEKKSYLERQNEWIEKNDIKVGDKVKVIRKASSGEDGWGWADKHWSDNKLACVGTEQIIKNFVGIKGVHIGNNYFPYFILEKVYTTVEPIKEPVVEKPKHSFIYTLINQYIDTTMDNLPYMLIKQYLEEGRAIFMEEDNPERMFQIKIEPVDFIIGEHNG